MDYVPKHDTKLLAIGNKRLLGVCVPGLDHEEFESPWIQHENNRTSSGASCKPFIQF